MNCHRIECEVHNSFCIDGLLFRALTAAACTKKQRERSIWSSGNKAKERAQLKWLVWKRPCGTMATCTMTTAMTMKPLKWEDKEKCPNRFEFRNWVRAMLSSSSNRQATSFGRFLLISQTCASIVIIPFMPRFARLLFANFVVRTSVNAIMVTNEMISARCTVCVCGGRWRAALSKTGDWRIHLFSILCPALMLQQLVHSTRNKQTSAVCRFTRFTPRVMLFAMLDAYVYPACATHIHNSRDVDVIGKYRSGNFCDDNDHFDAVPRCSWRWRRRQRQQQHGHNVLFIMNFISFFACINNYISLFGRRIFIHVRIAAHSGLARLTLTVRYRVRSQTIQNKLNLYLFYSCVSKSELCVCVRRDVVLDVIETNFYLFLLLCA